MLVSVGVCVGVPVLVGVLVGVVVGLLVGVDVTFGVGVGVTSYVYPVKITPIVSVEPELVAVRPLNTDSLVVSM